MHLLIPYAAAPGPRCQSALDTLTLPHLEQLLQRVQVQATDNGSSTDLSPLHEKATARAQGLRAGDGLLPWAAQDAHRLGLTALHGLDGWAWITPCHWSVHADHVAMSDPLQLALTTKDYEILRHAMQPYFSEDGITLFAHDLGHHPVRWLAHGAVFRDLPTAGLDRVSGFTVDPWMPRQNQAHSLRKLQNEMQMLLYTHPLNDTRASYKLPGINSFWVSGTGTLDTQGKSALAAPAGPLQVNDSLRQPALRDDPGAWAMAWHALDNTVLSNTMKALADGQEVCITLVGERHAVKLAQPPAKLWQRLRLRLAAPSPAELLKTL